MNAFRTLARFALIATGLVQLTFADVKLPALITDHMVIQRDLPVHFWGWADPGEPVSVVFLHPNATTNADDLGRWSVTLPPGEAGGPFTLDIKGKNTITISDVLVGDVWVASGQSNMEFRLRTAQNADAEISAAKYANIRLFTVQKDVSAYPVTDVKASPWAACTPETAADFSAVAYFFGRNLNQKLGIPIGLIHSSWGGTPAEAWTSMEGLGSDASFMPLFTGWAKIANSYSEEMLRGELEQREAEKAQKEGRPAKPVKWRPNQRLSWSPAGLFNAMIAPLTPLPIKGVIWYQGESNADAMRAPLYRDLFSAMITDWRRAWGEGDFPFLFVQIANYKTSPESKWPLLRDAQRKTLALKNTGMAVTIDIGNPENIHPTNKQDVGLRLALAARGITYGENIEYSGPLFRQAAPVGSAVQVWFDHTGGGLVAKGGELGPFEIAGADHKFKPATARIDGKTVIVNSPEVPSPAYVRYGWSDIPRCTLYNTDNLPASPFSSE